MERSQSLKEALQVVVKGTCLGKIKNRLLGTSICELNFRLDLDNFRITSEDQDHQGSTKKSLFCFPKENSDRGCIVHHVGKQKLLNRLGS